MRRLDERWLVAEMVALGRDLAPPKPWNKQDIATFKRQLDFHVLFNEPYRARATLRASIEAPAVKLAIVMERLGGFRNLIAERGEAQRESAAHFLANPSVYGASTDEVVERCSREARECEASVAQIEGMIQRLGIEGLPPEVANYLPPRLNGGPTDDARAYGCLINRLEFK